MLPRVARAAEALESDFRPAGLQPPKGLRFVQALVRYLAQAVTVVGRSQVRL